MNLSPLGSATEVESVFGFILWAASSIWQFATGQGPEFILSIAAISLAIWNGRQSSRHSALSVLPAFSAWADYPRATSTKCEITLANKGFGPAIIEETLVFLHARRIDGFQFESIESAIRLAFDEYLEDCYQVSTGERGHAVGVDEVIRLAGFKVKPELVKLGNDAFAEMLRPITITIKYKDIYQRKWLFIVKDFVGHTFRVNSPSYFFWHQFRFRKYLK